MWRKLFKILSGHEMTAYYGGKALGLFSLALGIISICISLIPCVNIISVILGLISIICGVYSIRNKYKSTRYFSKSRAVTGIFLAACAIVLTVYIDRKVILHYYHKMNHSEGYHTV